MIISKAIWDLYGGPGVLWKAKSISFLKPFRFLIHFVFKTVSLEGGGKAQKSHKFLRQ